MKKLLVIIFALFVISCNSMVRNGKIKPKKQKSNEMIVMSNGFKYNYRMNRRIDINYYIVIKFKNIRNVIGDYLIVEFQDPEKPTKFYSQTLPITKDDVIMHIESEKLYGLKNMHSYITNLKIVNNNKGDEVLDSIKQYSRVEYKPFDYKNQMY